jgi:hypothetical protein
VAIFFNDLQRGGRLAERVSGQSPFLKAPMNGRGSPVICGFGNLIIEGGVDAGRHRTAPSHGSLPVPQ